MAENKTEVLIFRAEPRLANAVRDAAKTEAMSIADYIRTVLRLHLFGYAPHGNSQNTNVGQESA